MILSSCDDNLMEWGKDPEHGEVTGAELPLALVEKISRYEPLKNYSDFFFRKRNRNKFVHERC